MATGALDPTELGGCHGPASPRTARGLSPAARWKQVNRDGTGAFFGPRQSSTLRSVAGWREIRLEVGDGKETAMQQAAHPVLFTVDYPDRPLDRLTTGFRIFVDIPILIVLASVSGSGAGSGAPTTPAPPPAAPTGYC